MTKKKKTETAVAVEEAAWEIPSSWRWEPLGQLGTWFGGGTPSKGNSKYWTGGKIPWVSPKDMKVSYLEDSEDHITEAAVQASSTKLIPADSVVCVMRSGILRHSFPVAVARRQVTLNQDLRAISPRSDMDAAFLAHFLRRSAHEILHTCSKDGTTVNSIETDRLLALPVPIPPLAVQKHIAARIDSLFAEIEEGETAVTEARLGLDTYGKSLLNAAVAGKLTAAWREQYGPRDTGIDLLESLSKERLKRTASTRFKQVQSAKFDYLPSLPAGWVWASLGQLAWSAQYGTSQKCSPFGRGDAVLRIPNLRDGAIDLSDLKRASAALKVEDVDYIHPGDLLIVRTNGSEDLIGRTGVVIEAFQEPTYFASYLIRFRLLGSETLWRWVRLFTGSGIFRTFVLDSIGSSAGQYNLNLEKLFSFPIAVPPASEMRAAIDIYNGLVDAAPEVPVNVKELRQSVLNAAFRGDLIS